MEENKLSLTEKPRWEIVVSSKLDEYGVKQKFHPTILKGIETTVPFLIIVIPCILAAIFSNNEK